MILENIKSPKDLKELDAKQTETLCKEIRTELLETISVNGGHLASNLGVVELSVAIHKVFDSPDDSIIFDVGHQCYTHKLLTGRYETFKTIRQENGISGFMRPDESIYDPVVSGHSSTSISSAYGICKGDAIQNISSHAVAVIGDGALTGGIAYEALNNAGRDKNNLIVILNDNKMSISKNVGALARHLSLIRSKPSYHRFKHIVETVVLKIPFIGKRVHSSLLRSKNLLKNAIYNTNIFSSMGFTYMGPVDGHNMDQLISVLNIAKNENRPVMIHAITTKGKGYPMAETSPGNFHGVGSFDLEVGYNAAGKESFSSIFGKTLCDIAAKDKKICAVTAAMTDGTGLLQFAKEYKSRFFDVGIAEQHAITFCGGLAKTGLKPVFAVYSSFLQRGYDQIIHDAAIAKLPVTLCVDRAGFVGEDGETHQGLFDVAFLSSIPGVKIFAPSNYNELSAMLRERLDNPIGVAAIRYPRGAEDNNISDYQYNHKDFDVIGSGKTAIICYGNMFAEVKKAVMKLSDIAIIKLNVVNPLNSDIIKILMDYTRIFSFEEAVKNGSVSQSIAAALCENKYNGLYRSVTVDGFVCQATIQSLRKKYMLDHESILKIISEDK
ncbi:MAG: 1-deoxy-D-xylulose-5-phosphate synthase [Oscillospiraceae bacterium]